MAFCNISREAYEMMFGRVISDVVDDQFIGTKEEMKKTYNLIFGAFKNELQALMYAGLIPDILINGALRLPNAETKIREVTTMDALFDLKSRFADNLGEVKAYLFGEQPGLNDKQVGALLDLLDSTNHYTLYVEILSQPETRMFLKEKGNEALLEKYKAKEKQLYNSYEKELIDKNDALIARLKAEQESKKKPTEEKPKDEKFSEPESREFEPEMTNIDPINALKFNTPNSSVNDQIPFDPLSGPNDEIKINDNEYDNLMTTFFNSHDLISEEFDIYLINDTKELIERRKFNEEDRKKALDNMGQVAVFRDRYGKEITFGSSNTVTNPSHPYYNIPIVVSVNKKAFLKYMDLRAAIFARRFKVSMAEVNEYYNLEMESMNEARKNLRDHKVKEYKLTVIHQSTGVYELTDEGPIAGRFRKGGSSALIDVEVMKTDGEMHGLKYKKGQIVAVLQGATKQQAILASAPTIDNLQGEIGKSIRNGIESLMFKAYAKEEDAKAVARDFLRKVLYTREGRAEIYVVEGRDEKENKVYRIVYKKKVLVKDGYEIVNVTAGTIMDQRININEQLRTTDKLVVPISDAPRIISPKEYNNMIKASISTNRKAVRDNEGNFHLDKVNAYFSFALPDLSPGIYVADVREVKLIVNNNLRTFRVRLRIDSETGRHFIDIFEGGRLVTEKDMPYGSERLEIARKAKEARDAEDLKKGAKTAEDIAAEDALNRDIEKQKAEEKKEEVEEIQKAEDTEEKKDVVKGVNKDYEKSAVPVGGSFRTSTGRYTVNFNSNSPFKDSFAKSNRIITEKDVMDILKTLQSGTDIRGAEAMQFGNYYIIKNQNESEYKVFDENLDVVPDSVLEPKNIEEFNNKYPCK